MSKSKAPSQVSLIATEVREINSKQTGTIYRICVGLPYDYADKPELTWPVVYLLDAHFYFGMVSDIVRSIAWCSSTTEAIVVGITYPVEGTPWKAWKQIIGWRAHDLTPEQSEQDDKEDSDMAGRAIQTGGAPAFLKFIQGELIPVIEKDYRANPAHRTLAGHSYGGLFTLFALFQAPGLFHAYIASSPTLRFKESVMFEYESQFAKRRKKLPAKVHLSIGELEESAEIGGVSNLYRLGALLESRKYKGLFLVKRVFPGEDHCSVIALAFQAGLKLALAK